MLRVILDGTKTVAAVGTEEDLLTIAVPGRYRLMLDIDALAIDVTPDPAVPEILEVTIKPKVLSGGTERALDLITAVAGLDPFPILLSEEFWVPQTATLRIKQTNGAARGIPYSLMTVDPLRRATVASDAGNTASTFKSTDLTESGTDHWKDAYLMFLTGALKDQVKKVSAFNPSTDFLTVGSAFTAAPSAGDVFVLVNR